MLDIIEQAIKPHDRYQVEMKLDYELLDGQDTHYRVSTYIFVPNSLGITPQSYPSRDFYRDVQNYIRLKTPVLSLRDLCDYSSAPLVNIERIIKSENWSRDPALKALLVNNFKLASATLKSAIRDHFALIERRIDEAPSGSDIQSQIYNLVTEFEGGTETFARKYRALYVTFNLPHIDAQIFDAYSLTDESISLLIEEGAIEIFPVVERYLSGENRDTYMQGLSERVRLETAHRLAHGYDSVLEVGEENETYPYRAAALKKYASSVLHLSLDVSREGRGREQLLYAFAAGIAMVFATVVAFYFQRAYGSFTFPAFIALVIGYMFKDRIKEVGRETFARRLQNSVYDRRTNIRTRDGKHKLGVLREKVTFVRESDVPKPVLRARDRSLFADLHNDGQAEQILRYTKDIVLHAGAFAGAFDDMAPITGINDIMRYDIREYLKKMAEPIQERPYLKDGQMAAVTCHRVYHLNIISRYRSIQPQKEKLHRRIRLVLTGQGLKRIENIRV